MNLFRRLASVLVLVLCPGRVFSFSVPRSLPATKSHDAAVIRSLLCAAPTNGQGTTAQDDHVSKRRQFASFPKRAVKAYTQYAGRLWNETNPEARRRHANDRAATVVRQVHSIIRDDDHVEFLDVSPEARENLVTACDAWLKEVESANTTSTLEASSVETTESEASQVAVVDEEDTSASKPKKKKQRSILFGAMMGLAVAGWVFSGNLIFTGLFALVTLLGQLEYYRLVMQTGVYPARRISVLGASSMFLTALFIPTLHEICLPLFGLWAMVWFLTMKRTITTIPEIASTFTGMFYLGYVPSFWVRIRMLGGGREPTKLATIAAPFLNFVQTKAQTRLPSWLPQMVHLPITTGAIFIFWSWLCIAFGDVGAYFVGKTYGKTKLAAVSPAAGFASPNKSVEGVIGGCTVSGLLGMFGGWVQNWPCWWATGFAHGAILGLLGLLGDLTASLLKRDADMKDFGDLIPEHGGIMDRVDSYIWAAPYCWLMITVILPWLKTFR